MEPGRRVQVVDREFAGDAEGRGVDALDEPLGLVELVGDLADQLLQKVLERDEPRGPAVLVHDDRHVELLRLELLQKRVGTLGLGDEVRRVQPRAQVEVGREALACVGQEVLGVEDAHDDVDRPLVHGDAGV